MLYTNFFMGDLYNQFQLNLLHDIISDTVAPLGVENATYHEDNNVHRMNNCEWTDERRQRIFKRDTEEKKKAETFHEESERKMGHRISNSCKNSTKPNR